MLGNIFDKNGVDKTGHVEKCHGGKRLKIQPVNEVTLHLPSVKD